MKILSIETSCDETAISILEATGDLPNPIFKVLGNSLLSQTEIHKEFGGVFPNLARREHGRNLVPLLIETFKKASLLPDSSVNISDELRKDLEEIFIKEPELSALFFEHVARLDKPDIDRIVVTEGPGLEPALWVGITFAEALGRLWNIKIIPANHMEGHIFSVLLDAKDPLEFPVLALLVSGGHTELVLVSDFKTFKILGKTRDDAVGEAFDKVARILDLGYPGGPKISALADLHRQTNKESTIKFPRPMIHSKDLDFSFSGLKTAVLYKTKEIGILNENIKMEIAREFEDAALDVLIFKTKKAIEDQNIKTLVVGGGVSANRELRKRLTSLVETYPYLKVLIPEINLSTDNAIMIAIAGFIRIASGRAPKDNLSKLKAEGNLTYNK